jgi:hypothetical protein
MAVLWFISYRKEYCEAVSVKSVVELMTSRVCLFVHEILYELFQTTNFNTCH